MARQTEDRTGPAPAGRLRRELTSFGVLLLTLSSLSPVVSIFGMGGDVLKQAGTGAALLFGLGIAAAVVWGVVYAELGSAFPYAGGDYVGVGRVLGSWAGVVTLAIWAVTAGPADAFVAKTLAVYLGQLWPQAPAWPMPYIAVAASTAVALLAVRKGALVTGLFLAVELVAVAVLLAVGASHPARGLGAIMAGPVTVGAGGGLAPVSLAALALTAISAVYATVGGNQAIYFGEELGDPHRKMGRVVVVAAIGGAMATALPVIFVVLGARDLTAVLKSPAPFAAFLSQRLGAWAGPALGAGVALAVFNALIVNVMGNARLYFSLGRDGLFSGPVNRAFAKIDPQSGVPRGATLMVGAFSLACCALSAHVLLVFLTGLLVYGWSLVCLAVLVGRLKGLTGGPGYWRSPLFPLAPVLGLLMAAVFTVSDLADPDAGRPSLLLLGAVVLLAVLWSRLVLQRRPGGWTPRLGEGSA